MSGGKEKITFISKNKTKCPICGGAFHREDLLTGMGRLIAGSITKDLKRAYEPSKKYGDVYPLIYSVTTCPDCYYSAYPTDFESVPSESITILSNNTERRIESIKLIFDGLDFKKNRGLKEGIASYYFSIMAYDHFPKQFNPTFKRALSSLRTAWLLSDMHKKFPNDNFDYLSKIFYRKARFFYMLTIEREGNGEEPIATTLNLGPDIDNNFGYDGMLYVYAFLEYYYGPRNNPEKRKAALEFAKKTIAKIFGSGKISKDKPQVILENAKELFASIGNEMRSGEANGSP